MNGFENIDETLGSGQERLTVLMSLNDKLATIARFAFNPAQGNANPYLKIDCQNKVMMSYGSFILSYNKCRSDEPLLFDRASGLISGICQNEKHDPLCEELYERMAVPHPYYNTTIDDARFALLDFILDDGMRGIKKRLLRAQDKEYYRLQSMVFTADQLRQGMKPLVQGVPEEKMGNGLQKMMAASALLVLEMADEAKRLAVPGEDLIAMMTYRSNSALRTFSPGN